MPRPILTVLINAAELDAVPAALYTASSPARQRGLSRADWLIRRKSDGRYLGTWIDRACPAWQPWIRAPGLSRDALRALLERLDARRGCAVDAPVSVLAPIRALGIDVEAYAARSGLAWQPEPGRLHYAGRDRYARPLWLTAAAARGWQAMQFSARGDGIALDAISGFRSQAYQLGIFRRKLARGLGIEQILQVNAAPGFSEHHAGEAVDIGTPGEPAAEESFERTPAFAWLQQHAPRFGFALSYPRDNPHGISYEPWHWRFRAARAEAATTGR